MALLAVLVAIPGIGSQAGNIVQFIESIVTHGRPSEESAKGRGWPQVREYTASLGRHQRRAKLVRIRTAAGRRTVDRPAAGPRVPGGVNWYALCYHCSEVSWGHFNQAGPCSRGPTLRRSGKTGAGLSSDSWGDYAWN
ncbi:hypothetical protein PSm6_33290 [Pseudomonas solani]|uniref:Uncharacterized protein n=1 Tax=Pseudomonas solani TaxID=2731552 RepID=A0ABN6BTK6_9PSED|nr:hypothetical protein PSm6_33290 [Pseudomonas solani]